MNICSGGTCVPAASYDTDVRFLRPGAPFRKKRRQLYLINLSSNFQTNFLTNKCENGDGGGCAEASVCGRCGDEGYVEAQLKEYLAAAGPKSKLMNKARYDQTIQIVESEKGQTTGCRHSCCRN
jgi:hypothetical protein